MQRLLCKYFFAINCLQTFLGMLRAAALGWRHADRESAPVPLDPPLRSPRLLGDPPRALPAGVRGGVRRAQARGRRDHARALDAHVREHPGARSRRAESCSATSSRTFYTVSSADATPEIQEIEETLAPLMSAHQDSIQLDAAALLAHQDGARSARRRSTSSPSSATSSSGTTARCPTPAPGSTTPRKRRSPRSTSACRRSPRPSRRTC